MNGYNLRGYDLDNKRRFANEVSCEFHISIETEDIDNKDIPLIHSFPVMTGYSFDMTIEQHVSSFSVSNTNFSNAGDFDNNLPHTLALERFGGKGPQAPNDTEVCYGDFYTESLTYKADNKKVVTSTLKFQGTGELHVGNYTSRASTLSEDGEE